MDPRELLSMLVSKLGAARVIAIVRELDSGPVEVVRVKQEHREIVEQKLRRSGVKDGE